MQQCAIDVLERGDVRVIFQASVNRTLLGPGRDEAMGKQGATCSHAFLHAVSACNTDLTARREASQTQASLPFL